MCTITTLKRITSIASALALAALVSGRGTVGVASAQAPASSSPSPNVPPEQTELAVPIDYVIGPEDVLGIVFWREKEMSGDIPVRPDGKITVPLIGEVTAAGLQPEALREQLRLAAGKYLTDANVTVVVRQINSRKVFITGEVMMPGGFPLISPLTVMQLIAMAGGVTPYADAKSIMIMRTENGRPRTFKFNYKDVAKARNLSQNIQLQPGDMVVVP